MPRPAGPSGTGLIPPSAVPRSAPQADPPPPPETEELVPPPEDTQDPPQIDPTVIDSVPPVSPEEPAGDPAGPEGDEYVDVEALRAEIVAEVEARFQRRFDKAITKITRRAQAGLPPDPADPEPGDDPGGQPPPVRRHRAPGPQVDVNAIRVLAREEIDDQIGQLGREEQRTVRTVFDRLVPHIDWASVDDQSEFVEELVRTLSGTAQTLVKAGSDRKVAQLRNLGLLPDRPAQPASSPRGEGAPPTTSAQLAKGRDAALRRWPKGSRSVFSR